MKTANIYMETVKGIPAEITKQTELSFSVADKIQDILSRKGWSQKQFAQKMRKTEAEVSVWLSGQHNFTLRTIAKISVASDVVILKIAD